MSDGVRQRAREERSRRGVAAAVRAARKRGLTVDEPVVRPSGELPAGPHTEDGFAITCWAYLHVDPDRPPAAAADCSAMLGDLHAVLEDYPGEVPVLGVRDIAGGLGPFMAAPDPEILLRCKELRTLQVVLALVAFHEEFGDLDGWAESIRSMLGELA